MNRVWVLVNNIEDRMDAQNNCHSRANPIQQDNLSKLTCHVNAAVGKFTTGEKDDVVVTERMQADKRLVSRTVHAMLRNLGQVLAGGGVFVLVPTLPHTCPPRRLQTHLRGIIKRMKPSGINNRPPDRVQRKITAQKDPVRTLSKRSFAKSRRASVAMLKHALRSNMSSGSTSQLPTIPAVGPMPTIPAVGPLPTIPAVGLAGGAEGKLKIMHPLHKRASRSGTCLRLVSTDEMYPRTVFGSTKNTNTLQESDRHSDIADTKNGELLSDISTAIQRIVLWSHPT